MNERDWEWVLNGNNTTNVKRFKVPNGWLYCTYDCDMISTNFIPEESREKALDKQDTAFGTLEWLEKEILKLKDKSATNPFPAGILYGYESAHKHLTERLKDGSGSKET